MNLTADIKIPTQSTAVPVMSIFGWIMFHQHLGHIFDWNLPWADYKAGFGSTHGNFWLGLEKVHLLTSSQPYRLRVELQERSTNLWYSAEYWSFKIGDELNDQYRLEVAGYSGDAGDSLQYEGDWNGNQQFGYFYHNGMKFTTYDNDNDLRSDNCATAKSGGWWYNRCFMACLMCEEENNGWWTLPQPLIDQTTVVPQALVINSKMLIKPQ